MARRIYERSHLTGDFTLRSGATTNEYFDKYLFESDPELLREIAEALVDMLPEGVDAVAGLELGGVPLVTVVSQLLTCRLFSFASRRRRTGPADLPRAAMSQGAGWR